MLLACIYTGDRERGGGGMREGVEGEGERGEERE